MQSRMMRGVVSAVATGLVTVLGVAAVHAGDNIPDIRGSWSGANMKLSDRAGFTSVEKTIHVTEQQDRRFRGYFIYDPKGVKETKNFFGIIYPDNETLSWVSMGSKGYVHGRVHGEDRISVCYIETGAKAAVGCADMRRFAKPAQK